MKWKFFNSSVVVAIAAMLVACSEGQVDASANACQIMQDHTKWKRALEQSQKDYDVAPSVVLALIHQESKFNATAKSSSSTAYGYAQAINATWQSYVTTTGHSSAKRNNFKDSADFVGWYLSDLSASLDISKSNVNDLYLAYMLGYAGFKRYKNQVGPNAEAVRHQEIMAQKVAEKSQAYAHQLSQCSI